MQSLYTGLKDPALECEQSKHKDHSYFLMFTLWMAKTQLLNKQIMANWLEMNKKIREH